MEVVWDIFQVLAAIFHLHCMKSRDAGFHWAELRRIGITSFIP